jgi:cobalt/nickel transport system ATP-binding protein
MSHHIVEVQDLKFTYPDHTSALNGITFRIEHGESVAIVGANGAGKSTLLLHLNGYLAPIEGKVRIGDYPLTKNTVQEVRRTVGMVFQDPDDQLFMSTVFDDVAFGPLNLGLPAEDVSERVQNALQTVGVFHLKDRPSYRLSAGQRRLGSVLGILRHTVALKHRGFHLATLGVDPKALNQLIDLLKSFKHSKIIATHDLDLVLDLCERTIIIHDGLVKADGTTNEIFNDEILLSECHLEKPISMKNCPVCNPS